MSKRISVNAFEKVIKDNFSNFVSAEWRGIEVEMKKSLPISEVVAFVNEVATSVFQDDAGYMPEITDFLIKANIIKRYTNLSLPSNLEKQYDFIYLSDVITFICDQINMTQLNEIVSAIQKKITYKCDTNVSAIQKQVSEVLTAFDELQNNATNLFSKVDAQDIARLTAALAEHGDLDEKKMVHAVLDYRDAGEKE